MILNAIGGAGGSGDVTTVSEVTCTVITYNGTGYAIAIPIPYSDFQPFDVLYIQNSSSSGNQDIIDGFCLTVAYLENNDPYYTGYAVGLAKIGMESGYDSIYSASYCLDGDSTNHTVNLRWADVSGNTDGNAVLGLSTSSSSYQFSTTAQYKAVLLRPNI